MNLYELYVASGLRAKNILASRNMTTKLIWSWADYCMRIKEQSISEPLSRRIKAISYSQYHLFFLSGILQTVSQRLTGSNRCWYHILDEEKVDWIQRGLKKHLANGQIWWCSMSDSSPRGCVCVGGVIQGLSQWVLFDLPLFEILFSWLIEPLEGLTGGTILTI